MINDLILFNLFKYYNNMETTIKAHNFLFILNREFSQLLWTKSIQKMSEQTLEFESDHSIESE